MTGVTTWNQTVVSTYNNSQYNNTTSGLVSVTNADKWHSVNWIYRFIDGDNLPKIGIVLGTDEYDTLAKAAAAPIPTIPTILSCHAILIGRIIVKHKDMTVAIEIDSEFTTIFAYAGISEHNNLAGLEGGTVDEYYHLTNAQHSSVTYGPSTATDNALARFDLTTGKIIQNSGVIVDDNNNTGIGQTTFGTNATKTLALSTGVAPTTSPTDAIQIYSKDFAAGNAVPTFKTENGTEIQLNQSLTTTSNVTFGNLTAIYKGITSQVGVTSTLTATMTHVEQTVGSIITSLWAAPTTGDIVTIKNNSSGVNTVSGNGKSIEAFSTWTLNAGEAITLIYNGSIWIIDGIGNALILTEQWTTAPVAYNSAGIKGQFAYDNIYKYECVATNTWVRYAVERSF